MPKPVACSNVIIGGIDGSCSINENFPWTNRIGDAVESPTSPYTRFTPAATSVSINTFATRFLAMSFLFIFYLCGATRTPYGKVAREGDCRRSTSIQSTLESIRFDTCARIEAEQQNGQRADDYDRSYHCNQTLFGCELHAMARGWDLIIPRSRHRPFANLWPGRTRRARDGDLTVPLVGSSRRLSNRKKDDLPAPLGPTTASISPWRTSTLMSLTRTLPGTAR